jgi:hypothetical protein
MAAAEALDAKKLAGPSYLSGSVVPSEDSMRFAACSLLAALAMSAPAMAASVPTGAFDQVRLLGGGHVSVRHGAKQSVNMIKGSLEHTEFRIKEGHMLEISACNRSCPMTYDLEVEIVTPELKAAAINGGGEIVADGSFPAQDALDVAINGGGDIDMRSISAANVDAAVKGGGDIEITATRELNAAVSGGGDIVYHGNPQVNEAIRGGGSVNSAK